MSAIVRGHGASRDPATWMWVLAQSPDPLLRLVAAADGLRSQLPGADEAIDASGAQGVLRVLIGDLAEDQDPWVRAAACSSIWLPVEIAEAVADLGGPGRLRAGWVEIVDQMGGDTDDIALRLAVAAPRGELVSSRPELWRIWGALANAKTPIPRLISLQVPALASAAAAHYGSQAIVDQVAELATDPDLQVRRTARGLPRGWPR